MIPKSGKTPLNPFHAFSHANQVGQQKLRAMTCYNVMDQLRRVNRSICDHFNWLPVHGILNEKRKRMRKRRCKKNKRVVLNLFKRVGSESCWLQIIDQNYMKFLRFLVSLLYILTHQTRKLNWKTLVYFQGLQIYSETE